MKNYNKHYAPVLLISYLIYSAFIPTNIAHSIIVLSLATLAGYNLFLSSQETTKLNEESLRELREEFSNQLVGVKEAHDKKLSKLEDEMAKMQLNQLPSKTVSSSPSPRKFAGGTW